MTSVRVRASSPGRMVVSTTASGKMANSMAEASLSVRTVSRGLVNGKMAERSSGSTE
jgi:hypothetical protein